MGTAYTVCIGGSKRRKDNLTLIRERSFKPFPDIRFSTETGTQPLFLRRQALFVNQVAYLMSDCDARETTLYSKSTEWEVGRTSEEKEQEIVRLDIDLLSCDNRVYKPEDLKRDYIICELGESDEKI